MRPRFPTLLISIFAVFCSTAGCGEHAPTRYPINGSVIWQGRPVPAGYLVFTPDASRGNPGPGAQAEIKDGYYRTSEADGPIGGPHQVTVYGFDGQPYQDGSVTVASGRPLFAGYTTTIDLASEEQTHNFSVP